MPWLSCVLCKRFFITFTANPKWLEIRRELKNGQQTNDQSNLIARVFQMKIKALLNKLKKDLLDLFAELIYTIDYQMHGLSYGHILLIFTVDALDSTNPDIVDQVVCAELPLHDKDLDSLLTEQIKSCLVNGPNEEWIPNVPGNSSIQH